MTSVDALPEELLQRVREGLPVVYPTSTLPALGCIPEPTALDRLFETKGRVEAQLVSLGVADLEQAATLVEVPSQAHEILSAFPEGALTLVLPALTTLDARLGGDAVAVRVLADARARALVERVGPLTATSANRSGVSPKGDCAAAAAALDLPENAVLPGVCVGGRPSTLIAWNVSGTVSNVPAWAILREGTVSEEEIRAWSMRRT